MDVLALSRWQFGITTIYHFFFVPLTLGLVLLVAIMETLYVSTHNEMYKRMTQFWGRLFLINFALGVVTGLVQEFQFGMNWSDYSRFVGDIFGAPLAIEALLAFFLESTFIGLWHFGWGRFSPRLHLLCAWMIVLGSNISALWILIANSFMQEPVGYTMHNGRAEMTNFFALITNPNVLVQFPHVFFSGVVTGAFFLLGISAYHLLRKHSNKEFFRRSFTIGLIAALLGSFLVALVGHTQAQHMVRVQPMKMAAAEALWNSEDPAAFSIFTIGDEKNRSDVFAIRIPDLLSILAYNEAGGQIQGINNLQAQYVAKYGPGDYVPPVAVTYWSFRLMVGAGVVMILLSLAALFLVWRKRLEQTRWFLWLLVAATILPYLANSAGWIMTEIGRQPWIVFGLLKTAQAVSPNVTAPTVLLSLVVYTLLYGGLALVDGYLLLKYARVADPVAAEDAKQVDEDAAILVGGY
ncbi:cytochrome ubiquinol oxidase subunit I [Ktedonobacter sp. SOSP1-85]|uniref:cytochrome ubiquinol oxidase subunit I n=1 Tax=Ktedonobacter sp. SOSP1-85 TaxID=2778367 RepID=UPI00191559F4|nr:cytochrome ubiquinol oxidase subunit I [Ktedonobacter sp. SOSP1-85]GHO77663.1 cytochrome ubiquinol oxidase subunit I [Ktedonobacter sp. SOSP1-85]